MSASRLASGKGHRDENFPVASWLIARRHRAPILTFYRFARAADDIADHPTAPAEEKLHLLEEMDRTLTGELDSAPEALALRRVLAERGLGAQHPLLLLEAFRRDVTRLRYADWDELMDYCRYSAMPVGRFVLDVHGEDRATWPASDALCAALQVINHLQDCGKDYRALNRVYIPRDLFDDVEALGGTKATPGLLQAVRAMAQRTMVLLAGSRPLAGQIRDRRLALEVSVIRTLAEDLNQRLMRRDPLSERVHHRKFELMPLALAAFMGFLRRRQNSRVS
ncbi:MAG TPA: squalene synthase HpnC [Rhizomicrobium sp.]|jgi:squalene synthase HpnC|nr:squalene synthase HpnC [Rhizomicrobium sp.]